MKIQSRTIRIFLSSTFRDFGEERDLLVRKVFPELRSRLKDRFVELVDVDLRWGITVEQAERGEVLPICLAEIDRARPFFVGMLGERYGWVPLADAYAPDLVERQPWLDRHRGGKSVTELEILHGVLNNPKMAGRAFFYFRSRAYARAKAGEYLPASRDDEARQNALKARIHKSGFPVVRYRDPEAFAKRLERDLWKLLDAEFPAESVPDAFERERLKHEAYAAPRRRLYLGGEHYIKALHVALDAKAPRILIEGASGGGKSALLANALAAYRKAHRKDLVHEHYLGASADAADPHALVRRLVEAIRRTTGSGEEIPGDPQKLMDSLPLWLATASAWAGKRKTRWIVVLDALNSLTDLQDLRWLPEFLPPRVQLLISCLQGNVREALGAKGTWKTIGVRPLTRAGREQLLVVYLARYNKTLPKALLKKALAHPLAANPLFIRTLAEELRLFGVHEELEAKLAHYLESATVDDLFERVLERVEQDCGKAAVKTTMTAIWASRAGLTEEEILGIAKLVPATWAPIRNALDEALLESSGRIAFAHDYMRIAVKDRYLPTEARQRGAHRTLAKWFQQPPASARRAEEEPYQWRQAQSWLDLRDCLTTWDMFVSVLEYQGRRELLSYWLELECVTKRELETSYERAFLAIARRSCKEDLGSLVMRLSGFLFYASRYGHFSEKVARLALKLFDGSLGEDSAEAACAADGLANLLRVRGNFDEALGLFERALSIRMCRFGEKHIDSAASRNNLANLQADMGLLEAADQNYLSALSTQQETLGQNHPSTTGTLNNLAIVARAKGELSRARKLLESALATRRRVHGQEHPFYAMTLDNLATLLDALGDWNGAVIMYKEAFDVRKRVLGPWHIETGMSLNNLSAHMMKVGDLDQAAQYALQALRVYERCLGPANVSVATPLHNVASIQLRQGKLDDAELLTKRALSLRRTALGPHHPEVAASLAYLGSVVHDQGRYREAVSIYLEALTIYERRFGSDHHSCAEVRNNLAESYRANGDLNEAIKQAEKALAIRRGFFGDSHPDVFQTLAVIAGLYGEAKNFEKAGDCFRMAIEGFKRAFGEDHIETAMLSMNLASMLADAGQYEKALAGYARSYEVVRTALGEQHPYVAMTVGNIGLLYCDMARFEESISPLKQAYETLARLLGPDHPDVAMAQINLGNAFVFLNKIEEARLLYGRAIEIRTVVFGPYHQKTKAVQEKLAKLSGN